MTKEQWYDELTSKPLTINNRIYTFTKPDTFSNLADLEIDTLDKQRIMLSDYIIEENKDTGELYIRITYSRRNPNNRIVIKGNSINPEYFGQYMILSKRDFEQAVVSELFWVEEY